jgi:hypothetical protein
MIRQVFVTFLFTLGWLALILAILWFLVTQPFVMSSGNTPVALEVSPEDLRKHVVTLAHKLPARNDNPANLEVSAKYIEGEWSKTKARVSRQNVEVRGVTYCNIRAEFGPEKGERIVIGAHYDAYDGQPGADDNASGIAGLIELARLLQTETLPITVELVAFTLEEPPYFRSEYMGSAVHAAWLQSQGISVRLMMSLEMLGYFTDAPNSQEYPLPFLNRFYPTQGNFVAVVGNFSNFLTVRRAKQIMLDATPLPVLSINSPSLLPGIDFSDHLNYWHKGMNAMMITDTAFYRNKAYHSAADTADKLDYKRMAQAVQGVFALVKNFSVHL